MTAGSDTAAKGCVELIVEADGGSRGNPGPAGYGALVRDAADGHVLAERAGFIGVASNNVAEYSGLVAGLRAAAQLAPEGHVEVRMDSRLVVEQMSGRWQIKHADMRRLAAEARAAFPPGRVRYTWVPRAQNSAADALANEAMDHRRDVVRDYGADSAARSAPLVASVVEPLLSEDDARGAPRADAGPDATERPSGGALRFDGAVPATIVLVRHGVTEMTVARQYSGSGVDGPPLTQAGRTQAARAADLVHAVGRRRWTDLPRVDRVLASTLQRTQETGAAVGRRLGLHVDPAPDLVEANFGEWEGLTPAQIEEGWPGMLEAWHRDPEISAPGGESVRVLAERVRSALGAVREAATDESPGSIAVVSHAMVIRAAVGIALLAPARRWSGIRIPAASVTILRWWPDGDSEVVVVGHPSEP